MLQLTKSSYLQYSVLQYILFHLMILILMFSIFSNICEVNQIFSNVSFQRFFINSQRASESNRRYAYSNLSFYPHLIVIYQETISNLQEPKLMQKRTESETNKTMKDFQLTICFKMQILDANIQSTFKRKFQAYQRELIPDLAKQQHA